MVEQVTISMKETKELIDLELSKFLSSMHQLKLHPQIEYALSSKGKRLRPLIVLLSAQSVGGNRNHVMPLAIAFELMHNNSLVHDDIIDEDEMRRGIPALHKKWSVSAAILTGDALIALAVYLASGYGEEILKIISGCALELCDGEYREISMSLNSATEKEYFQMIEKKSASLFRVAAHCGALAGGASQSEVDCLSMFGENFGMTYQLRDDLLDLRLGEGILSKDLSSGRVTLPLIHLYRAGNFAERKTLERDLRAVVRDNRNVSDAAIKRILQRLDASDSIAYCEKKLDEYLQRTVASIAPLRNSPYKACLLQMAESLKKTRL